MELTVKGEIYTLLFSFECLKLLVMVIFVVSDAMLKVKFSPFRSSRNLLSTFLSVSLSGYPSFMHISPNFPYFPSMRSLSISSTFSLTLLGFYIPLSILI